MQASITSCPAVGSGEVAFRDSSKCTLERSGGSTQRLDNLSQGRRILHRPLKSHVLYSRKADGVPRYLK